MNAEKLYDLLESSLPKLFIFIALPMTLFFAFSVPPFQTPDEFAHLFRATQLSYGELVGTRLDEKNSGGYVDSSYRAFSQIFLPKGNTFCQVLHVPPVVGPSKEMLQAASGIIWGAGQREFISCPNTVSYGPFMYIPQTAALSLARTSGINALHALYLARWLNSLLP